MQSSLTVAQRRRPENWAILEALESLTPPTSSPSLGVDELSTFCSYGEIPIFLDVEVAPETSDISPPGGEGHHGPKSPLPCNISDVHAGDFSGQPYDNEDVSPTVDIHVPPPSVSVQSCESYYNTHYLDNSGGSYCTISSNLTSPPLSKALTSNSHTRSIPGSLSASPWITPVGSAEASPVGSPRPASFLSLSSLCGSERSATASNVRCHDIPSSSHSRGSFRPSSPLSRSLFGSGSVLSPSPSIMIADISPSPSGPTRSRSPLRPPNKSASCSPLPEPGPFLHNPPCTVEISAPSSAPVAPDIPAFNMRSTRHRRTGSSATSNSNRSVRSARSSRISSPLVSPSCKSTSSYNLPGILGWLRDINLELWIDQDGSRAIRPAFTLMGYTSTVSDDRNVELVNSLTYGTADFRPVTRQMFLFHFGKSDTPPVLRRLTIAGDETKDYISRHASLTLKPNGVYTVSGVELFDSQSPASQSNVQVLPHQEPLRLRWKFEYVVDDHFANATATIVSGEKTFTPLRFSCSPGLLHPTHGKKIKLMHVFKKNRAPRLIAEKMEVPRLCRGLGITDCPNRSHENIKGQFQAPSAEDGGPRQKLSKLPRAHSSGPSLLLRGQEQGEPKMRSSKGARPLSIAIACHEHNPRGRSPVSKEPLDRSLDIINSLQNTRPKVLRSTLTDLIAVYANSLNRSTPELRVPQSPLHNDSSKS
ncbi:hypothetical protein AcV5_005148 [Taiwanofungus camphoratus]|nr:hypothetical protein AcV5_005148 [Antrodia cinnamomea]